MKERTNLISFPLPLIILENSNGDVFVRIKRNFYVLSSTNVKTAKASVEPDRTDILKLVQSKSGYDKFNIAIDSLIRQWVIRFIEDTAPSRWEDMFDGGYDKDCVILQPYCDCLVI